MGRNIWLSVQAYSLASLVPKGRHQTFPKNILVSLKGYEILSNSSITGKGSNRNKQSRVPKEQLDPKVCLAIKGIKHLFVYK